MTDVPCNGCTACCARDLIVLHPEMGDDPDNYVTIKIAHPFTGKAAQAIRPREDGTSGCRYLGAGGCTIYERRPVLCREFDCRKLVSRMSKQERKRAVKAGMASRKVMQAGFDRLHTLEAKR